MMRIRCIIWITRIVKIRVATFRVTGMTVMAGMMVTGVTSLSGMTRVTFITGFTGKIWLTGMV